LPFDLDQHRQALDDQIRKGCQLSGVPLDWSSKGRRVFNSPSLDRKVAAEGYVFSNVRVICWALNAAFNEWGEEMMELVTRAWLERRDG
jgi:hypothetical protein